MKKQVKWNKELLVLKEMNKEDFCSLKEDINFVHTVEDECDEFYYLDTEENGIIGFYKEDFTVVTRKK